MPPHMVSRTVWAPWGQHLGDCPGAAAVGSRLACKPSSPATKPLQASRSGTRPSDRLTLAWADEFPKRSSGVMLGMGRKEVVPGGRACRSYGRLDCSRHELLN